MKNLFKNLMLVAVAAMAFTACTEEQNEVNATKNGTVLTFTANFADDTRVVFEDENADGTYTASFEAYDSQTYTGDRVTFAAYNGDQLIDDVEVNVSESGKTATFVVKFTETLESNYTIVAHLNKYFDYFGNIGYYGSGVNSQTPDENGMVSDVYATSEPIVYGNQENLNLTFNYDHAFGKVTFKNDLDLEDVYVTVKSGDDTYNYTLREVGTKKSVMFNCEPVAKVDYIKFSTNVVEGEDIVEYIFEKENPANGELAFVAGHVSAFNVTLAEEVREPLATPEVTAELDVNGNLVFSWDAVDGAGSYDVSLNYADAQTQDETNYTIAAAELEPLTTYRVSVVANPAGDALPSASASAEFTTSVNEDDEADFYVTCDTLVDAGNNKFYYKNSTTPGTNFASISYNAAPTTGVYTPGNEGEFTFTDGGGASVILVEDRTNGSYEGFWLSNGASKVFVECEDGIQKSVVIYSKQSFGIIRLEYTAPEVVVNKLATPEILSAVADDNNVTVSWTAVEFASKYIVTVGPKSVEVDNTTTTTTIGGLEYNTKYSVSVVAKGDGVSYTDSDAATTTVTTEEEEVVTVVSAVATASQFNKHYDVVFTLSNGDTITFICNTDGNTYLKEGVWATDGAANKINYAIYNGTYVSGGMTVGYDKDEQVYTITDIYCDGSVSGLSYTGVISNFDEPQVEEGSEGDEPEVLPEFVIPGEGTYDMDYRYTKLVDGLDDSNGIRVAQDNGWIWDIKFNPGLSEIVAGDYTALRYFTTADALEVDTYNGGFQNDAYNYIYPDEFDKVTTFNVQKEGDFYCITMIGSGGWGNDIGTFRCVYIGKIVNN